MIAGLFHQRLSGGASGVIAVPSYEYVLAHSYGLYSAESEGVFTINPDGTWLSRGTNYPDRSGLWRSPVLAGAGDTLQVRVTLTKDLTPDYIGRQIVDGVIANAAADWVSLAEAKAVSVRVQRYTQAVVVAKYIARVEIRDGMTVISNSTFNYGVAVQVDKNGPASGGGANNGGNDGQLPVLEP